MYDRDCNLPKAEALEPRVLLSAVIEDIGAGGDYGDWFNTATVVDFGEAGSATIQGDIGEYRDYDFIKFSASMTGGMQFAMSADGSNVDSVLYLCNSRGKVIAANNNIARGVTDAGVSIAVESGQSYYLIAAGYRSQGTYQISVNSTVDEYGNNFAAAENIDIAAGQTYTIDSGIDYANDRDFVKFTAPVSGGLKIDMVGEGALDPFVVAYNQYYRCQGWNINASAETTDSSMVMKVEAGQTYYIWAGGWRRTAGEYSLSMLITEDQFGGTLASAGRVTLDENGAATVNSAYDYRWDIDVMKITAVHSEEITVNVTNTSNELVTPWMLVYNQAGRLVAYGTSRSGEAIDVTFDAQQGQTYYLRTFNRNPRTTGEFQVDITTDVPPPAPEPDPTPDPQPDPQPDPDPDPDPAPNPDPAPVPTPGQSVITEIITDGSSNVLRVLGTNSIDLITISQAVGSITIDVAGSASSYAGTFTSILVYAFGGGDTIRTTYSLSTSTVIYGGDGNDTIYENGTARAVIHGQDGDDLLVSIGGGVDTIFGGAGLDSFWYDSSDTVSDASAAEINGKSLHRVASFYQPWTTNVSSADYVSMSINGQNMRDPVTSYNYKNFSHIKLFVDGAQYDDVAQGSVGDCYYLATLASLADTDPQIIGQMITSLGDGTYAMRFYRNGSEVYLRLDADLPYYGSSSLVYAKTGQDNELWVPLAEKAYAFFRYGQNSYASISGGWMSTTNREITGESSVWQYTSGSTTTLANNIRSALDAGHALTLGSYSNASSPVVGGHAYVIMSIDENNYVTVYNPWGVDGRSWDSNYGDGLLRLSINQIQNNYLAVITSMA